MRIVDQQACQPLRRCRVGGCAALGQVWVWLAGWVGGGWVGGMGWLVGYQALEAHSCSSSTTIPLHTPHPALHWLQDYGKRLDVWWPADRRSYRGTITAYSSAQQRHTVKYDDGDVGRVCLPAEKYR